MTSGMLCVIRRERRGVLHLEMYSPPKAISSEGEKRRGEEKKKKEIRKKDNGKEREPAIL